MAIYQAANVQPFPGGQFHEYVFAVVGPEGLPQFYDEALALGFTTIAISDNTVALTPGQRRRQIGMAVKRGLNVFGEVGSKETLSNPGLLVEQAQICFEAGASLVLVEAADWSTMGASGTTRSISSSAAFRSAAS